MCNHTRNFRAAVSEFQPAEGSIDPVSSLGAPSMIQHHRDVQRIVEHGDGAAREAECLLGQLTDVGRESTYNYGYALRKLYVDSPGVIPQLRIRNGRDENLLGNTLACPRLAALLVNFAHAAAAAYNPVLEPLDKKVSKYLGGNPIRIDDKTEEVRRLGMGRLLGDLSNKMQLKAQELNSTSSARNEPSPRILVHSTHDTALAALTSTLDVFDNRQAYSFLPADTHDAGHGLAHDHEYSDATQPPQNQGVLQTMLGTPFRLRRQKTASEYYVRARYQNRNLLLPLCADEGKHLPGSPEFCSLAAFAERVDELVPKDWEADCAVQS
ncbi:hypothetical protein EWM64_g5028 [Hericium alpestre]|uniref:Acid phosphatase n=1 Tax=Hericium alpestre TaxID=135208 RepID=A0A4Y9ZY36_9AGAM|nr:hypothetical protein EWM64_g5028 [Hericium alpestre]